MHGLLLHGSNGVRGECAEYQFPLPLLDVVDDAVQIPCSSQATVLSIELLSGSNEITGGVCLVCTFNLIYNDMRTLDRKGAAYIPQQWQVQGHRMAGFQLLGLRMEGVP